MAAEQPEKRITKKQKAVFWVVFTAVLIVIIYILEPYTKVPNTRTYQKYSLVLISIFILVIIIVGLFSRKRRMKK